MKKIFLIMILISVLASSILANNKEDIMSKKTNLEIVKLIPDMYNKNPEIADEIFDKNCLHHINGSLENEKGPEVNKKSISLIHQQFSNSETTFIEIISNKDSIAVRWSWKAINKLTKKEWKFNGNTIFHFENGKIVEYWAIDDRYREMQKHGFTIMPPQKN